MLGTMKLLLVLVVTLATTLAQAEDRKITGTFESVRLDILMGMPESVTAKHNESFEKSKQTVVITEKDISLNTGFGGGIYMTYTTQGDFMLGKTMIGKTEMFYPIYVKDSDTLFLAAQKFVRKKEESK
jgi:hypothetical protein